jgi:hypothetical protein
MLTWGARWRRQGCAGRAPSGRPFFRDGRALAVLADTRAAAAGGATLVAVGTRAHLANLAFNLRVWPGPKVRAHAGGVPG